MHYGNNSQQQAVLATILVALRRLRGYRQPRRSDCSEHAHQINFGAWIWQPAHSHRVPQQQNEPSVSSVRARPDAMPEPTLASVGMEGSVDESVDVSPRADAAEVCLCEGAGAIDRNRLEIGLFTSETSGSGAGEECGDRFLFDVPGDRA